MSRLVGSLLAALLASSAPSNASAQPSSASPPTDRAVSDSSPTARVIAVERYGDATIEFRAEGAEKAPTCRVFPDGTRTCLSRPIPRRRAGRISLSVGALAIGGGALAVVFSSMKHAFDCFFADPGCVPGGQTAFRTGAGFAVIGLAILTAGAVLTGQHRRGVRRLLDVSVGVTGEFRGATIRWAF